MKLNYWWGKAAIICAFLSSALCIGPVTMPVYLQASPNDWMHYKNQVLLFFESLPGSLQKIHYPQGPLLVGSWYISNKGSNFRLAIDTASPVTWLAASNASFSNPANLSITRNIYDSHTSSTCQSENKDRFQIMVSQGNLWGWFKSDLFGIEKENLYRMKFLEAESTPSRHD